MGNCLVLHCHENNMVRVMKSDGKILEYKAPIKVHQVLAQFSSHHAISNSLQPIHHLHPNTKLLKGKIFYLVPMSPSPSPSPKSSSKKKKVRFAEQEVVVEGKGAKENINTNDDDNNNNNGVVRIKIVISKQQLHDMIMQKGEIISVDELLSLVDRGENSNGEECDDDNHNNNNDGSIGWKPCLESIPELC